MVPPPEEPPSDSSPFFRPSYLYLLLVLAAAYIGVTWIRPVVLLSLPLGLLTVLFVPGYAIGALFLGARSRWPWSLTFAVVVGLSVAVSTAEGLVLLALHLGLPSRVFSVVAFVLVGIALLDRTRSAEEVRSAPSGSDLDAELGLPGHTKGQRVVGYGLLTAILVVFVVILYLASVFPNDTPSVSLGLSGPDGTAATLPTDGTVGQNLTVLATVGNNATGQVLDLTVRSTLSGSSPTNYTAVPWILPLPLGPNQTSTEPVSLDPGQTVTVQSRFTFPATGSYEVAFLLTNPAGTILVSTSISVSIT